jgi:hypothetical protein
MSTSRKIIEYLANLLSGFRMTEKQLITLAEKTNEGDIYQMTRNHLGLSFKRLLRQKTLSKGLLDNNLEKQFVIEWIYRNKKVSINSAGKDYLPDQILGRKATDEELLAINTTIQWLGTNVGMDFIQSVYKEK